MILAAGHGKRMGRLTASIPKPLLKVNGTNLLENKILALKQAGITDIVINVAYLAEKIQNFAGDGSAWDVNICYSEETNALETAGGINKALPLLGDSPFIVFNADVWTDFPLQNLASNSFVNNFVDKNLFGHLVMVDNPNVNPNGDFGLTENGLLTNLDAKEMGLTYSGVAVFHPEMFVRYPLRRERFPLLEVFRFAINQDKLSGEHYQGQWDDIGTPERLQAINARFGRAANDE